MARIQFGIDDCGSSVLIVMTAVPIGQLLAQDSSLEIDMDGTGPYAFYFNIDECTSEDSCDLGKYGRWDVTMTRGDDHRTYELEIINPCRRTIGSSDPTNPISLLNTDEYKVLDYSRMIAENGIVFTPQNYLTETMEYKQEYEYAGGTCGETEMTYKVNKILNEANELIDKDGQTYHDLWTSYSYNDIKLTKLTTEKWEFEFNSNFDRNYGAIYLQLEYQFIDLYTPVIDPVTNELVAVPVNVFTIHIGDMDDPNSDNQPLTRKNSCKPTLI